MLQYNNRIITGVVHDSRKVTPGNVFVAVKGLTDDGHDYIEQAINNGATLVVGEKNIEQSIPYIKVKNSRSALALLARNFYNRPDRDLITIGVTGTNGKTTITTIISHMLNSNNISTGLIGTNGISFNGHHWETILTTPDAVSLYKYLHQMVKENVRTVAMEVSSHSLKQQRLDGMQFNIAIFTNLALDHLDLHGTYQDYLKTKLQLGKKLKSKGVVLYNKDDVIAQEIETAGFDEIKIAYSMEDNKADIRGITKRITREGSEIEVKVNSSYFSFNGTFTLTTRLLGEHNASNVLAAIGCGLLLGLTPEEISNSMQTFEGVKRRLEIIYNKEFVIIDDFCHNPANYEAVLKTMEIFPRNNIHLVTLVRGNRGELVNSENAKVIARWGKMLRAKQIFVTNCEETVHPKDKANQQEELAFLKPLWQAGIKVHHTATLTQSLEQVLAEVGKNDLILLLGSHPFKNVAEQILSMIKNNNIYQNYKEFQQEKHW